MSEQSNLFTKGLISNDTFSAFRGQRGQFSLPALTPLSGWACRWPRQEGWRLVSGHRYKDVTDDDGLDNDDDAVNNDNSNHLDITMTF